MMKRFLPYSLFSKTLALSHRPRLADALFTSSSHSAAAAAAAAAAADALQPRSMTDYLITTIGFSPERAAKISEQLGGITSLRQPDSVVGFFKSHGLNGAEMRRLLSWNPRWLVVDVEKSLVPKFQALQDLGFSGSEIVQILRCSPVIFFYTVETMVAKIQFWHGILGSNELIMNLCKRNRWFLGYSISKRIKPNFDVLQECGVIGRKLTVIVKWYPTIIGQRTEALKALISRVESLGVHRSSPLFHWTLWVLTAVCPRKFSAQLELFKCLGWSEDEFLAAFRKTPAFVTFSSECLQKKMEFLVKEVGCDPSYIASHPVILTYSLEKRIIPRFQIITALKSRGLCSGDLKLTTFGRYTEEKFFNNYVFCHKEKFPELIGLYKIKFPKDIFYMFLMTGVQGLPGVEAKLLRLELAMKDGETEEQNLIEVYKYFHRG